MFRQSNGSRVATKPAHNQGHVGSLPRVGERSTFAGRAGSGAPAGGTAEMIMAEVLRQLAIRDEDEGGREIISEAVGDAMAGRRPRW